jgi:hypothetical protein
MGGKSVDTPVKALIGTNPMNKNPSKSDENKQSNYPAKAILVLAPLTPFYLENTKSLQKKIKNDWSNFCNIFYKEAF